MRIKTTVTEIECSANELRQSNALSDGLHNMLRGYFNNLTSDCDGYSKDGEAESEDDEDDRS